jgi:cytochrome c-type biogenesis protein CcmH/NrfG
LHGPYPPRILLFRMVMRPTEDPTEGDLASTTLAEIYVQQGLYERAVAIYQRLATRAPDDVEVTQRIASLLAEMERNQAGDEPTGTAPDPEFEQWLSLR